MTLTRSAARAAGRRARRGAQERHRPRARQRRGALRRPRSWRDRWGHPVAAVEALLRREPFFTRAVTELVLAGYLDPERLASGSAASHRVLTARETEVVQLLAEGRTSREVAATLRVSVNTIEAHRANVMRKLDLHTIADLVRYAIRERIVQP